MTTLGEQAALAAQDPGDLLDGGSSPRARTAPLVTLYYRLKPLIPRQVQLTARRLYSRRQATRTFPAWPIEPILVHRQHEEFRRLIREAEGAPVPFTNFWPDRRRFALILTHDVEGPEGVANLHRLLELEQHYGFVSSWNFVGEEYPLPKGLFDELREARCEIGLHGLVHDGSLFRSRSHFLRQLPRIHWLLEQWEAVGFRSPSTHRNSHWMQELGCSYDSSFPDTDPFEPQPGGCCSIFPFFLGDIVELPITMPQDHTLFEILQEPSIRLWREKAEWIIRHHGLVNVLVHPDYLLTDRRLQQYDELLAFLASQEGCWHALPREMAAWWRARQASEMGETADVPAPVEYRYGRATTAYAREEEGRIVFDL